MPENRSKIRAAVDRERKKSSEGRRRNTTGRPILYPGIEPATAERPIGDTTKVPERYPDESFEHYLDRVRSGRLE